MKNTVLCIVAIMLSSSTLFSQTTPDSVMVMLACDTCSVFACPVNDDIDTTGATTSTCAAPFGYTVVGPDANRCFEYKPSGPATDTQETCIITCEPSPVKCDTTIITIVPQIPTLDTVVLTPECDTCNVTACGVNDDINTTGATTSCGSPVGYTESGPDANGCFTYTPMTPPTDTQEACIISCDPDGRCDTTIVIIAPSEPTPDTVVLMPSCDTCSVIACPVNDDIDTADAFTSYCMTPTGYSMNNIQYWNGCATYTPTTPPTDTQETCMVTCDKNGRCDTTIIYFIPPPQPTIFDTIQFFYDSNTNCIVDPNEVAYADTNYVFTLYENGQLYGSYKMDTNAQIIVAIFPTQKYTLSSILLKNCDLGGEYRFGTSSSNQSHKISINDTIIFERGSLFIGGLCSSDSTSINLSVVSLLDSSQVLLNWGDGRVDTFEIPQAYSEVNTFSIAEQHKYATNGIYNLSIDANIGAKQVNLYQKSLEIEECGNLVGQVFIDTNNNCVFDTSMEKALYSANWYGRSLRLLDSNQNLIRYVFTDSLGNYSVKVPKSDTHYLQAPPRSTINCNSSSSILEVLPFTASTDTVDIPLNADSVNNVVNYWSSGSARPNRYFYIYPRYNGTFKLSTANYRVIFPPKVIYNSSFGNTSTLSNDTVYVSASSGYHYLRFKIDTTATISDTLCFKIILDPVLGETDISDNEVSFCVPVRTSYDPNDKQSGAKSVVANGDFYDPNDRLHYQVRFQNTGTASADNVYVIDKLDANLDPSTLIVHNLSHTGKVYMSETGHLKFDFPNINLPDSNSNEPESHGHIIYSIKPVAGLPVNTTIENTASIFFDWNEPIITNTTYNTYRKCDSMISDFDFDTTTLGKLVLKYSGSTATNVEYIIGGNSYTTLTQITDSVVIVFDKDTLVEVTCIAINKCGNDDTTTLSIPITICDTPEAKFEITTIINKIVEVKYNGSYENNLEYFWGDGNSTKVFTPITQAVSYSYASSFTDSIKITAVVTNDCGNTDTFSLWHFFCMDSSSYTVVKTCDSPYLLESSDDGSLIFLEWDDKSIQKTKNINVPAFIVGIYQIKSNGCFYRDSIELIKTQAPTLSKSIHQLDCNKTPIILDASRSGFSSYKWSSGQINSSIEVSEPGVYTVVLTHECGEFTDSFVVEQTNIPSFDTIEKTVCTEYEWGDSTYLDSGTYTRIFNTGGCDSVVTLKLKVGLNPQVTLTNGTHYEVVDDFNSYQWYLCSPWKKIRNETKKKFYTTTRGKYAVIVSNGECSDTSECIALYSSGIHNSDNNGILIFPNPVKGKLHIELDKNYKNITIEITNIAGERILHQSVQNDDKMEINTKLLATGAYFISIDNGIEKSVIKFIKE